MYANASFFVEELEARDFVIGVRFIYVNTPI